MEYFKTEKSLRKEKLRWNRLAEYFYQKKKRKTSRIISSIKEFQLAGIVMFLCSFHDEHIPHGKLSSDIQDWLCQLSHCGKTCKRSRAQIGQRVRPESQSIEAGGKPLQLST